MDKGCHLWAMVGDKYVCTLKFMGSVFTVIKAVSFFLYLMGPSYFYLHQKKINLTSRTTENVYIEFWIGMLVSLIFKLLPHTVIVI